jgi:hypothetical protein
MRIRLLAILILALILSFAFPGAPAAIRGQSSLSLAGCSLPEGLQLPIGQGIALVCRVGGEAPVIHVEFLVDQGVHHAADVRPGDIVSWSWVPTQVGRHTLAILARKQMGSGRVPPARASSAWPVATFSRHVFVLAADSPVRIP